MFGQLLVARSTRSLLFFWCFLRRELGQWRMLGCDCLHPQRLVVVASSGPASGVFHVLPLSAFLAVRRRTLSAVLGQLVARSTRRLHLFVCFLRR